MAFSHNNKKGTTYYLHKRDVKLRGSGKTQTIFFFAKDQREGSIDELPQGYKVVENERTGLPILKKA